jgi:hypothetical protein
MAATMPDPSTRLILPAADRMADFIAPWTKRNTKAVLSFGDTKEERNDRKTLQSWYCWIGAR